MTGILLSTVVPTALIGAIALILAPRTARRPEHEWLPGELAAVKAMPDRPLSGRLRPAAVAVVPVPQTRQPELVVDADLGLLSIPPGPPPPTRIFNHLLARHRLAAVHGYDWT